eukprot:1522734-Pyramimonas_sp.AAC.1
MEKRNKLDRVHLAIDRKEASHKVIDALAHSMQHSADEIEDMLEHFEIPEGTQPAIRGLMGDNAIVKQH